MAQVATDRPTPPSMGIREISSTTLTTTNIGRGEMGSQNSEEGLPINTEEFKGKDLQRSDTPETLLTEFTYCPDITILCDQCNIYVDIRNLAYHRSYHDALITLNYRHPQKPSDVRSLLQRRNIVLKKMKMEASKENKLRPQDIQKVDEAYELLKSDLEDVYEEMKQVHNKVDTSVRGVALSCSPDCAYAVGMCSNENNRWKSYMEDVKVYQDYFGEDRNKCYLGIFDGHHGAFAAERSGSEFHHLLLHEMAKFDSKIKSTIARNFADSAAARTDYESLRPETRDSFRVNLHQDSAQIVQSIMDMCYKKYDEIMQTKKDNEEKKETKRRERHPKTEQMHKTFRKTYLMMDILLSYGKDERSKVRWSGTSALTIIIENTKSKGGSDNNLTSLQAVQEESSGSEKSSEKSGNQVQPTEELGLIHVANSGSSRALLVRDNKPYRLTKDHTPKNPKERQRILQAGGDLSQSEKDCLVNGVLSVTRSLGNHGDKRLKGCVIVDPHVKTVPIDQYAQFLVLASNGVWEVFSDDEVASFLVKMLPDQQIPPPSRFNESVLQLLEQQRKDSSNNGSENSVKSAPNTPKNEHLQPLVSQNTKVSFSEYLKKNSSKTNAASEKMTPGLETEGLGEKTVTDDKLSSSKETNTLVVHGDADDTGTKNVVADLHTEIGSRCSDGGADISLHSGRNNQGQAEDYVTVVEHSNIQEPVPVTDDERRRELAKSMAEQLTQAALLAGAKDNVTVMVVLLPACGI